MFMRYVVEDSPSKTSSFSAVSSGGGCSACNVFNWLHYACGTNAAFVQDDGKQPTTTYETRSAHPAPILKDILLPEAVVFNSCEPSGLFTRHSKRAICHVIEKILGGRTKPSYSGLTSCNTHFLLSRINHPVLLAHAITKTFATQPGWKLPRNASYILTPLRLAVVRGLIPENCAVAELFDEGATLNVPRNDGSHVEVNRADLTATNL